MAQRLATLENVTRWRTDSSILAVAQLIGSALNPTSRRFPQRSTSLSLARVLKVRILQESCDPRALFGDRVPSAVGASG